MKERNVLYLSKRLSLLLVVLVNYQFLVRVESFNGL
ncbi:unnamed protein product [Brassica oleracea]